MSSDFTVLHPVLRRTVSLDMDARALGELLKKEDRIIEVVACFWMCVCAKNEKAGINFHGPVSRLNPVTLVRYLMLSVTALGEKTHLTLN